MTEPLRSAAGSDRSDPSVARSAEGLTAGAMLKAARERQGLHIAILAATIKVSPRKLEALEQDRHEDLSNASFVRALAQSVCRSLKIDPLPVLALLPVPEPTSLERSVGSLNAPFRDRPGRTESAISGGASRPVLWTGALLLLAAAAVYFVPPPWWARLLKMPERVVAEPPVATKPTLAEPEVAPKPEVTAPAERTASTPVPPPDSAPAVPSAAPLAVAEAVPPPVAPVASQPMAPVASRVQLSANAVSWVEVVDSEGKVLLSRTLMPGEAVDVDGAFPLRLKVGNASGTQVALRGRPVDLSSYTRDNVARLELR